MLTDFSEVYRFVLSGMSYGELQRLSNNKKIKLNGFSKIQNNTVRNKAILKLQAPKYVRLAYALLLNDSDFSGLFDKTEFFFSSDVKSDLNKVIQSNTNKKIEESIGRYLINLITNLGLTKTIQIYKENINFFQSSVLEKNIIEVQPNIKDDSIVRGEESNVDNKEKVLEKQKKEITKLRNEKTRYLKTIEDYIYEIETTKTNAESVTNLLEDQVKKLEEELMKYKNNIENLESKLYRSETKRKELEKNLKQQESKLNFPKVSECEQVVALADQKLKNEKVNKESPIELNMQSNKKQKIIIIGQSAAPKYIPANLVFFRERNIDVIQNQIKKEQPKEVWILDYGVIPLFKRQVLAITEPNIPTKIIKTFYDLNDKIKEEMK